MDQQRVFIAGRTPGAIAVLRVGAPSDPTLAGYVRQTCEQILTLVEVELAQDGRLPEAVLVLVRELRAEYTRAAGGQQQDGVLIARFCRVLGEAHFEPEPVISPDAAVASSDQEPELDTLSSQELTILCGQELERAEAIAAQGRELSQFFIDRLYRLRDAYNEALSREAEARGGGEEDEDDLEDGDAELFRRFKVVLGEVPRRESTGRPFSENKRLKPADTVRGGATYIVRKP